MGRKPKTPQAVEATPAPLTLAGLLRTDDPQKQMEIVRQLVAADMRHEVFILITARPNLDELRFEASKNATYDELIVALDGVRQAITEAKVRAQLAAQQPKPTGDTVPHAHPPAASPPS